MKKQIQIIVTLLCVMALMSVSADAQVATGGSYSLDQSVIAGGGGQGSAGGTFSLDGTIGQSAAGTLQQGGTFTHIAGFWNQPSPAGPTASDVSISGSVTTAEGAPLGGVVVALSGSKNAKAITNAKGEYLFDDLEANGFYVVTPSRINYSFAPANHALSLNGNRTDAIFTAMLSDTGGAANPLDTPEFFARQQYLDFLGREPDATGFNFWSKELNLQLAACGADANCQQNAQARISAAFFRSIEFQQTGDEVYRAYRVGFNRAPRYAEFLPDAATIGRGVIIGQSNWEQLLAMNTKSFFEDLVARSAFRQRYAEELTAVEFVDALNQNAGNVLNDNERNRLIVSLSAGVETRASTLQKIAGNATVRQREFNRAFVLMQYFGYLKRNPDDAPDGNFDGYSFWLEKLNRFKGDAEAAEMVKAFITAPEFRSRFK